MGMVCDGTDDRGDLGTLPGWGPAQIASAGFTIELWIKTTQTSVLPLLPVYSQNSATADGQEFWFLLSATHNGGSLVNNASGGIVVDHGDLNDNGYVWQKIPSVNCANGAWHHIALVSKVPTTRAMSLYIDGVLDAGAWTKTFDDPVTTGVELTSSAPIAARKITTGGGTYFDFAAAEYEKPRLWTRQLSPNEIAEIYLQRGRDSINRAGLLRDYPLLADGKDLSPNNTALTPQNGPTFAQVYHLDGNRRRAA